MISVITINEMKILQVVGIYFINEHSE